MDVFVVTRCFIIIFIIIFFICFFLHSFLTFTNLFAIVKNTVSLNACGTTRNDNRAVKYVFCFHFETNSFPFRTFVTDQFHSLQKNPSVQALAQFPLNSVVPSHGRLTASLHSFLVNKKNNGSNSSTWKKQFTLAFLVNLLDICLNATSFVVVVVIFLSCCSFVIFV